MASLTALAHARADAWWSWHHPAIARALIWGAHEHLLATLKKALSENRAAGRTPDSMDSLSHRMRIRRDPRNIDRTIGGRYALFDGFRLALATTL